ncbi:type II toxin-antitoxin system RelE/ParE family toxin [Chitinophaga sp. CC14]|uniref:type II toxin-antitoxin system RelE/ParE family toxin n=1 Tax=Chitinophaga sp. CC14 TaxID=3029199 RepID=UPI003B7975D2
MSYTVVILLSAEKEIAEAFSWYEEQKEGLGDRFIKTLRRHITHLADYPEHYQTHHQNYRKSKLDSFPYVIVFKLYKSQKEIIVSSIFHTSRKPTRKISKT